MQTDSNFHVDLKQMILAIETTVDLVGMNDTNHGKRVAFIATQIANALNWCEDDIHFVFELGLLHDCGVSTEQMHSSLVNHFDWEDAHIHCEIGYKLLSSFEPLKKFAMPIFHHHTKYEELKDLQLEQKDKMMANLIFLADRIDILSALHYENDILFAKQEIVENILRCKDSFFNPTFVEAFYEVQKSEAFWISLEDRHITRYTWDMGRYKNNLNLTIEQIKQLSLILSYIVDQKSPFTAQHSTRVGCLAYYLAQKINLSTLQCQKIQIAGFLHDIGKLHTPDYILEKKGKLTDFERSVMNQHSFETFQILRHIQGLEDIAVWAAYHHEHLDRSGYPFQPNENELSIEARIIAVADIFQALAQDRPYRKGMSLEKILEILNEFADIGKVDKDIVQIAIDNKDKCFDIANGKTKENKQIEKLLFDI
ncbi:HD domain-containing phosphohydrolase [Arcobacter sp. YIC-464]|uniref:HD-GYP domain-containing protein n=1 Tax=Arcobacter sp. YIC-464 TaxID=3376631 RepID=UPI003C13FD42